MRLIRAHSQIESCGASDYQSSSSSIAVPSLPDGAPETLICQSIGLRHLPFDGDLNHFFALQHFLTYSRFRSPSITISQPQDYRILVVRIAEVAKQGPESFSFTYLTFGGIAAGSVDS